VSLPPLKFDDTEKAALRIHSSYSIGKHTPAEIAGLAKGQGLSVLALTDCATVNGVPETIIEGEKLGIYVVPGVEIRSSHKTFLGYFIDYRDVNFLRFLRKTRNLKDSFPRPQEVQQAILNAGGVFTPASSGREIFGELKGANFLLTLQEKLPDNSLHKDYFKRMFWRSNNLSAEEFAGSLQPQIVRIKKMKFGSILNTITNNTEVPIGFQGYPFIIVRGEAMEKMNVIKNILDDLNCFVISEIQTDLYREIAWIIYKMGCGSTVQQTRNLLKFNLDYHLDGENSAKCLILFFQNSKNIPLRNIKKALRKNIGVVKFYRLEYLNHIDMFFTSFVHIPDEENIQHENWILHNLGITVPVPENKAQSA